MPYAKKSVVILIEEAEDGYSARVWMWPQQPMPVRVPDLDNTNPEPTFRTHRVAANKTELKTEFAAFVDGTL